jgi:hypothetical protein
MSAKHRRGAEAGTGDEGRQTRRRFVFVYSEGSARKTGGFFACS